MDLRISRGQLMLSLNFLEEVVLPLFTRHKVLALRLNEELHDKAKWTPDRARGDDEGGAGGC